MESCVRKITTTSVKPAEVRVPLALSEYADSWEEGQRMFEGARATLQEIFKEQGVSGSSLQQNVEQATEKSATRALTSMDEGETRN